MTLSSDPRYQALAALAASILGNPAPSIVKAILAQWQCELGNVPYPPTRNNPGNIARGFAQGVGIPFTIAPGPNPQPGNPIVTYNTPADGARAYAGGIRSFSRYGLARAAVSRGDGRGFLLGLTAAGWGTNAACALRVYGGETGTVSTTPAPDATLASATDHILTQADLDTLYQEAKDSYAHGNPLAEWQWDNTPSLGPAVRQMLAAYLGKPASALPKSFNLNPSPLDAFGEIGAAIVGLPAAAGAAAGVLLVNGAILAVILALAYAGLRDLLGGTAQ